VAAGHAVTDVNQSAVPALLPFLVAERGLTFTAASGLVLASTVLSAVVQPSLGHLSDRRRLPWLAPLGLLVAGLGLAAAGLLEGYASLVACLLVSGLGVAAFHPEASRSALDHAPGERATGMSFFTVGGNLGTALGPVVATSLAAAFGVRGITLLALPAAFFAWRLRGLTGQPRTAAVPVPAATQAGSAPDPRGQARRSLEQRWAFFRLSGVIVLRSIFAFGLMTFVPLFLTQARGLPPQAAGAVVTGMLLVGILGSIAGGRLADRHGRRKVMIGALAPLPFLLLGFCWVTGPLGLLFLGAATAGSLAAYTVAVVLGQEYLPGREGIAMGITIGLAASIGGAGLPLLGMVADRWGLLAVLWVLALVPVAALAVAFTLPKEAGEASPSSGGKESRIAPPEAGPAKAEVAPSALHRSARRAPISGRPASVAPSYGTIPRSRAGPGPRRRGS
jgi:FSR family fosmidomycin resistance protein-like MFS transporter